MLKQRSKFLWSFMVLVLWGCGNPSTGLRVPDVQENDGVWVIRPANTNVTASQKIEGSDEQPTQVEASSLEENDPDFRLVNQDQGSFQTFDLHPQDHNPGVGCFENGCHMDVTIGVFGYMHQPFAEGLCEECHLVSESHPEGSGTHVSSMQDIEVCEPCHPTSGLGTSHPVDQELIDPQTGELFTCTSTCHGAHTAPYTGLLKLPGAGTLCLTCHEEDF